MTRSRVAQLACALSIVLVAVSSAKSQNTGRSGAQQVLDELSKAKSAQIAEAIIVREEAAAGRAFDKAYRAQVKAALASRSPGELASFEKRGFGLLPSPELLGASATASVLLPTSHSADLVFNPVVPCRILDTRLAGGPLPGGGSQRNFIAAETNYSGQGGFAGDCGIPFGPATAVAVNLTVVNPAAGGAGDLRAFPFPAAAPLASVLNYTNVTVALGNAIVLSICNPAVSTCTFDFTIQADGISTDLVADVMGYFSIPNCQAGTVKALGACFETATRTGSSVFGASDTCKAAGGRLATGLELRSLRGGGPLTLDAGGEWVDSVYVNGTATSAMTIADDGSFAVQDTLATIPFRCVFRPLP